MPSDGVSHHNTRELVCPWCGFVHTNSFEWFMEDGASAAGKCENCLMDFVATQEIVTTYSTNRAFID